MFTIRTGKLAHIACLALLVAACGRVQQDWRAAEGADTVEAYDQFIQRHPDSALVTEARNRVAQLSEDRDWREAGTVDTADAYRQFLSQHPNGRWAQEARIRIESFALGSDSAAPGQATAGGPGTTARGSAAPGRSGTPAGPASAGRSGAGIQLGAFNSEAAARKEWQLLEGRFGPQLKGLSPHIATAETQSGRLYRLQAVVGNDERARQVCEALRKRGQGCMTVLAR